MALLGPLARERPFTRHTTVGPCPVPCARWKRIALMQLHQLAGSTSRSSMRVHCMISCETPTRRHRCGRAVPSAGGLLASCWREPACGKRLWTSPRTSWDQRSWRRRTRGRKRFSRVSGCARSTTRNASECPDRGHTVSLCHAAHASASALMPAAAAATG